MRTMTVLALIRVPDDYDIGEDGIDCYEQALSLVETSAFAVVEEGVHPVLSALGADTVSWSDSPEGASA